MAITIASPHTAAGQQPGAPTIAVIVNRSNPLDNVTADDLRRLYLGTTTVFTSNKERVVLYQQDDLREAFYQAMLHMNADRFKRHWIGVVFGGLGAAPPKSVGEATQLRDLVGRERGAIGFLDARLADGSVKVLKVDGLRPGDPGYLVQGAAAAHGP